MLTPAGLVPFTTIDFPNRLAAVIFFQGCPLRCPFCHNPNLQPTHAQNTTDWEEIVPFLKSRQKQLDGVVFSGGEPLMQSDLKKGIQTVKDMGFQVAIHTSGVFPDKFAEVLPLIDWVGLDIKAPREKYALLTGRADITAAVQKSLRLLLQSQTDYEVRTTLDPRYLTVDDVYHLADELTAEKVQTYTLQKYRTFDTDQNPPQQSQIDSFFKDTALMTYLQNHFSHFTCR